MPKKFKGENSKAVAAKERRSALESERVAVKQKEEEDVLWQDDDKGNARKQQRKGDKERKRLEQLERKRELQQLETEESAQLKTKTITAPSKITRSQIESRKEQDRLRAAATAAEALNQTVTEAPLEENINRLTIEGDEARNVEEAIDVLSGTVAAADRHPEKRVKAAYNAFEEVNLPKLKVENPNMRLSQLKQMLKKSWQKSPENPLNQRLL